MKILISGSLAYDYIMDFPDTFKNHILPDQLHILSVCFVVKELQKNYGGTAGNIGYTMALLKGDPLIFGPLGRDATEYLEYFEKNNINTSYITKSIKKLTASAHITTDKDNNQITAFYSGACDEAVNLHISDVKENIKLAIISPTHKDAMIQHAKECKDANIPFVFDPGQQLGAFNQQEMMMLIGQAKFFIVNDYEMKLTQEKTGWDMNELLSHVEVIIMTLGEKGSIIKTKDQTFEVGSCPPLSIDDPTGAGDAYRSGFFTAYINGHDYKTCGQVGAVAATYAIEKYGTQNHTFTIEEFKERYKKTFKETIELQM